MYLRYISSSIIISRFWGNRLHWTDWQHRCNNKRSATSLTCGTDKNTQTAFTVCWCVSKCTGVIGVNNESLAGVAGRFRGSQLCTPRHVARWVTVKASKHLLWVYFVARKGRDQSCRTSLAVFNELSHYFYFQSIEIVLYGPCNPAGLSLAGCCSLTAGTHCRWQSRTRQFVAVNIIAKVEHVQLCRLCPKRMIFVAEMSHKCQTSFRLCRQCVPALITHIHPHHQLSLYRELIYQFC